VGFVFWCFALSLANPAVWLASRRYTNEMKEIIYFIFIKKGKRDILHITAHSYAL
jgi:hypothetical protein